MTTPRNGLWHPKIEGFETRISSGVLSPLPNWSFETYRRFPLISKMGALIQRTNCNFMLPKSLTEKQKLLQNYPRKR